MEKISIDPITRLEGHGKIEIFLNENGNVENAYLQVPELRGFEKFCEGRKAEDMPQLTSRICGVCPVSHHFASTKALDSAFNVKPTETAKKLRELMYVSYFIYDHILHFYFLGGPDFVVGPDAEPKKRNIFGVIEKVGLDLAKEVIKHRAYGQKMTEILGGKPTHPVCGLPGGVSKAISDGERKEIEEMANSSLEFAKLSLQILHDTVLSNKDYMDLITDPDTALKLHNMGLVDENNKINFYDGKVRVTDPEGKEFVKFNPEDYLDHIAEHVLEWSYVKVPYLKKFGWNGLIDGEESGIYRVGPLGRLNASEGFTTPLAHEEYERMYETFGTKPVHNTLAYHWARLIELLHAAERAVELSSDPKIVSDDVRNIPSEKPGRGVGIVEAARGTLIHDYELTEDALIKKVNLIVATTNNKGAICMSIRNAAKKFIQNNNINEGLLNRIEMFFRAYDPCFACASHNLPGKLPFNVKIYDARRNIFCIL
jgi:F420-non-reducing hydrogenase large subunit